MMTLTKATPKRKPLKPAVYRERFNQAANGDFKLLTEYEHSRKKVVIQHQACQKQFERLPLQFLITSTCPHCRKTKPRKTKEEFIAQLEKVHPQRYELIGTYVDTSTSIEVKHLWCGHHHHHRPIDLLTGPRCRICQPLTKSNELFKEEIAQLVGEEYELMTPYQHSLVKVTMRHQRCQKTYDVKPSAFLSGNRCPYCTKKAPTRTPEQYAAQFKAKHGTEFLLKSSYEGSLKDVLIEHASCQHRYWVNASRILHQPHRCPKCKTKA